MKHSVILLALVIAAVIFCDAESGPATRRDAALSKVDACLKRNERSSHDCKKLNENIEVLVEVYRSGDKSVLPTLLKFTYLTEFYDEALLGDPVAFLETVSALPEESQRQVAVGVAGGVFTPLPKVQFVALRTALTNIPKSSPVAPTAQQVLKELETNNASLFVTYFPPQTFTTRSAPLQTFWYSRDLYALGEQPLWPPASSPMSTYRFTRLGAFNGPESVTLTVLPDGAGNARIKKLKDGKLEDHSKSVTAEDIAKFSREVTEADYWHMPTELASGGLDGAYWILEGVQDNEYHIVVRWCPGMESHDQQTLAFANAARMLYEFSGYKRPNRC